MSCVLNLGFLSLPLSADCPFTHVVCFEPWFAVSATLSRLPLYTLRVFWTSGLRCLPPSAECPFTGSACSEMACAASISFSSKRVVCTEVGGFCHSQETVSSNAAWYERELAISASLSKLYFYCVSVVQLFSSHCQRLELCLEKRPGPTFGIWVMTYG